MEKNQYDLIVVGGSLGGCFAAMHAAKQGLSVLLIESRTYLGREITASLRPWIGSSGIDDLDESMKSVLGISVPLLSEEGQYEIPLNIGHIKRTLLHQLREAGVKVLFMSGAAGVLVAGQCLGGIVIGNKSGLQAITAGALIDATENRIVAQLGGQAQFEAARRRLIVSRTIQYQSVQTSGSSTIDVPKRFGLSRHQLVTHRGGGEHEVFVQFSFEVEACTGNYTEMTEWEIRGRELTVQISEYLLRHVPDFRTAVLVNASPELQQTPIARSSLEEREPEYDNLVVLDTARLLYDELDFQLLGVLVGRAKQAAEQAAACISHVGDAPRSLEQMKVKMREYEIPVSALSPFARHDRSMGIEYYSVSMKPNCCLPIVKEAVVAVAGGGTSGAAAAIGAAHLQSPTLLIEGHSDLGGTGTLGGINVYWYGYDGGFSAELDRQVELISRRISNGGKGKFWNIEAKKMTLLEQFTGLGGTVLFRTMVVDAWVRDRNIDHLLVLTPDGLGLIKAGIVIDATGDGDVAAFAGIPYELGDSKGNVQTFNMCDWRMNGFLHGINLDLGVVDATDVFDTTRGIIVGHANAKSDDFSSFLSVRESRHIKGSYTLTMQHIFNQTVFPDTIAIGMTDFDQHGLQSSTFARLGYLPYHKGSKVARLPYRACHTDQLDNLLIAGKAFSAERDAFSFLRMQRDMQNMGYAIGCASAQAFQDQVPVSRIDVTRLQDLLQHEQIIRQEDRQVRPTPSVDIGSILNKESEADSLLQLIGWPSEQIVPLLKICYGRTEYEPHRLTIAMALCWFGDARGEADIIASLQALHQRERNEATAPDQAPLGGFVDQPNLYWQINRLIILLGIARSHAAADLLCEIAMHTDSGGLPFQHPRLHWRRVPNYDRIVCLCASLEWLGIPRAAIALEALIAKPHLHGFVSTEKLDADRQYASAYLELVIAGAMAACGSREGLRILIAYLDDRQAVLSRHAHAQLKRISGIDLGPDSLAWRNRLLHANGGRTGTP